MEETEYHTLHVQRLFVKHQRQLRAFVLSLWPDITASDDILQEVFLTVTRKAYDFREGTDFVAWSRAIAQFKVIEARRIVRRNIVAAEVLEALVADCPASWADDRRLSSLSRCMKTLAPKARELIHLRYVEELSPTEIAKRLARTVNSIAVALAKARVLLRRCLDNQLSQREVS
jgi:RNA polymerase sigma-70 factor, ECF subfamily